MQGTWVLLSVRGHYVQRTRYRCHEAAVGSDLRADRQHWLSWLARYANCDGVFVLVCSGSLEADGVKKRIEIV